MRKAILVGLGSAGYSWYKRLKAQGLLAAVVETVPAMREKMGTDPYPFYTSLEEALEREQADFLVNVTSPSAHTIVNHAAFDRRLPVLCEKPIAFDYEESVEVVSRAVREGIPFMIAENYRRFPAIRLMKRKIDEGAIGCVSSIDIRFLRYHRVERQYRVQLLDDIGVHHFDLIRYLTGAEGTRICARQYNPNHGWQEPGAVLNADVWIELEGGIRAGYTGSIASSGEQTPWSGHIRIEGTEGSLELGGQALTLRRAREEKTESWDDFTGVHAPDTLSDFLQSLTDGLEPETSARDYIRTQALVQAAKQSAEAEGWIDVVQPVVGERLRA
ncbi:Predicted dehydrogenase [Paenibacillus sp. UNCCL117]|uniref:Gfo/Idh/MocA family protein n=1 Tax=unclassified Paenibacillus TaxID=185978 RepID=UPI0008867326|nr:MULTISPECIES: Gfo/Idh/MocA family oxidoreductase [unclassified Paenibacillus]SDD32208.1 Predicted dehydrogenase [Paenibacillus sp. cl123]SFW39906.1 Predicted dehydrogenase [Paenibacillus sp. UNCCL117]